VRKERQAGSPEVVTPLADAMRLIYDQSNQLLLLVEDAKLFAKGSGGEAFGGDCECGSDQLLKRRRRAVDLL
jgi:hypothetical protein